MILELEKFQEACKKILGAVDTDSAVKGVVYGYDTMEIRAFNGKLQLNVSNGEYYASVSLDYPISEEFRAVIDAKVFLTLVSKLNTKDVELNLDTKALTLKSGKSVYKFPLKCDDKGMVVLPTIEVNNPTVEFVIESSKLHSILNFNSKINLSSVSSAVQKYYYLDQEGCITFTNSTACVNSFPLTHPITLLLTPKVVKLFKLFDNKDVKFTMGFEDVGGLIQTRVKFENGNVVISSKLTNDSSLVNKVPAKSIRGLANKIYDYSVSIETKEVISAIDRLLLLDATNTNSLNKGIGIFEFNELGVTIYDSKKINQEFVEYQNVTSLPNQPVVLVLGLEELKAALENSEEEFLLFNFGLNDKSITLVNGNIKTVLAKKILKGTE